MEDCSIISKNDCYYFAPFPDSSGVMVVLFLKMYRVPRHNILHVTEKEQPNLVPSRVSSRHNVPYLVDGN